MKRSSLDERPEHWWQRIQWIDVVLVIIAVVILLLVTAQIWLPHYGPE